MAKNIELLLTESVDGTGIVGDVVKVRKGFARNFLLPRGYATTPSAEKLASLTTKRADAQKALAALRQSREALIAKLVGFELTMIRSCNDLGILYGAVTQHEVATALSAAGFPGIKDREVRMGQVIKRVDDYDLHIKFDTDLDATIKLHIKPDREIDLRRGSPEENAADAGAISQIAAAKAAEAELAAKREKDRKGWGTGNSDKAAADAPAEAKPEKKAKGEKAEKGEKPAKSEKSEKKKK